MAKSTAGFGKEGRRYSLLEYVLRETEQVHGSVRRYTSPDESPFFPGTDPRMLTSTFANISTRHTTLAADLAYSAGSPIGCSVLFIPV